MKKIFVFSLFILLYTTKLSAQVSVHPPAVFIDPSTRMGSMTVTNTSSEPREMEVYFKFAHSEIDSNGHTKLIYNDEEWKSKYDLEPYIKVFPQKMVLPPNVRQTVRFMVRGANKLENKVYWTRFVASSKPIEKQIDSVKEKISARIILATELVGIVIYQNGKINANCDFEYKSFSMDTSSAKIDINFTKNGNSPFWGLMAVEMYNDDDELIAGVTEYLALYQSGLRSFHFPSTNLEKGKTYKTKIFVSSERDDIPKENTIEFEPVLKEFEITIDN